MTNIKKNVLSKVPVRSSKSAKMAAIGAGIGALFNRKVAVLFAGFGAYLGSVMGERAESKVEEVESELVEEEVDSELIEEAEE